MIVKLKTTVRSGNHMSRKSTQTKLKWNKTQGKYIFPPSCFARLRDRSLGKKAADLCVAGAERRIAKRKGDEERECTFQIQVIGSHLSCTNRSVFIDSLVSCMIDLKSQRSKEISLFQVNLTYHFLFLCKNVFSSENFERLALLDIL